MAGCYYFALAVWAGSLTMTAYICSACFLRVGGTASVVSLGVALQCLNLAVPIPWRSEARSRRSCCCWSGLCFRWRGGLFWRLEEARELRDAWRAILRAQGGHESLGLDGVRFGVGGCGFDGSEVARRDCYFT